MTTARLKTTVLSVLLAIGAGVLPGCRLLMHDIGHEVSPQGEPLDVPGYTLRPGQWNPGRFIAGVGKADITPPPGFPTGGDGPAGNLARGYWTRLYARAFFFADASGKTAVFVSLDTFAVPGGLTAMVARQVGTTWNSEGMVIRPDAILIAATHTHQGPGNFLTAGTYNQFGSKFSGFSRPLFDFLVAQITSAINAAILDAKTANVAVDLRVRHTRAEGLQLNRSPATFLLNHMSQTMMDGYHPPIDKAECRPVVRRGEASRIGWDLPGCPRLRAADPSMTTIELQRAGVRIGVLIFFAIHPTVLDPAAPVNSSDFAGVAVSNLERQWSAPSSSPVVGFFNGAEGDIIARRNDRDVREVVQVARRFEQHVNAALKIAMAPLTSPAIVARREVIGASAACDAAPGWKLAAKPVPGTASLGGGEDDRSQLFALGWRDGVRYLARNGQGPKLPALDSDVLPGIQATSIFGPPRVWPSELPLQFIRIGTVAFAAFPAELSTATGAMVRAQLSAFSPLVIVGLANEYINYAASPDEYGAQDYMAASTMWGPYEGAVFACRMQRLATVSGYPEPQRIADKTYWPGVSPEQTKPPMSFGPPAIGDERAAPEEELEGILRLPSGAPARNLHAVEWQEAIRSVDDEFLATNRRSIRIQIRENGVWTSRPVAAGSAGVDDDSGVGLVALLRHSPPSTGTASAIRRWRAFWIAPLLDEIHPAGPYRFEVETRDATGRSTLCHSDPFTLTTSEGRPPALECRR